MIRFGDLIFMECYNEEMIWISGLLFLFYLCNACEMFYWYTEGNTHKMIYKGFVAVMSFMVSILLVI